MYALQEALAREHQRELARRVGRYERSGRNPAERRYRCGGTHLRQRGRR